MLPATVNPNPHRGIRHAFLNAAINGIIACTTTTHSGENFLVLLRSIPIGTFNDIVAPASAMARTGNAYGRSCRTGLRFATAARIATMAGGHEHPERYRDIPEFFSADEGEGEGEDETESSLCVSALAFDCLAPAFRLLLPPLVFLLLGRCLRCAFRSMFIMPSGKLNGPDRLIEAIGSAGGGKTSSEFFIGGVIVPVRVACALRVVGHRPIGVPASFVFLSLPADSRAEPTSGIAPPAPCTARKLESMAVRSSSTKIGPPGLPSLSKVLLDRDALRQPAGSTTSSLALVGSSPLRNGHLETQAEIARSTMHARASGCRPLAILYWMVYITSEV